MERFVRKFPYILLHFYAVAHFIIWFENANQLSAQKLGKLTTSLLYSPIYISNVAAPIKWTHLGLLKVRDFTSSDWERFPNLSNMVLSICLHEITVMVECSWYYSNRRSVRCLIKQPWRHAHCGGTPSHCLHCKNEAFYRRDLNKTSRWLNGSISDVSSW